jgi:AcrR family transcriptional regulator
MPVPGRGRRPAVDRSQRAVLDAATRVLIDDPAASLTDVATAVGIGRTTLHRMFPTRADLLTALAHDALDLIEQCYAEAFPAAAPGTEGGVESPLDTLRRLVEVLLPLGPRLKYIVTAPELGRDESLARRSAELDGPVHAAVRAAQRSGQIDEGLGPWWVTEVLYALVFVAWEQIEAGRLAPADAPDLVVRTWSAGVRPRVGGD